VVESTALEMRRTGNRIGGSNPSLSATTIDIIDVLGILYRSPLIGPLLR
jgi:hypothetical protein